MDTAWSNRGVKGFPNWFLDLLSELLGPCRPVKQACAEWIRTLELHGPDRAAF